jgi:hypothetical protein
MPKQGGLCETRVVTCELYREVIQRLSLFRAKIHVDCLLLVDKKCFELLNYFF